MGVFDFHQNQSLPDPDVTFGSIQPRNRTEYFDSMFTLVSKKELAASEQRNMNEERSLRVKAYNEALGDQYRNPKEGFGNKLYEDISQEHPEFSARFLSQMALSEGTFDPEAEKIIDDFILRKREQDPEKYKNVKTSIEMKKDIEVKVKEAMKTAQEIGRGVPTGLLSFGAGAAGAMTAAVLDPVNLIDIAFPASRLFKVGKAAKFAINLAQSGAIELAQYPQISRYNREMGIEYGLDDLAQNVGSVIAGGLVLKGVGTTIPPIYRVGKNGFSKAASWSGLGDRLKRFGDGDAAAEAKVLSRRYEVEEHNLSRDGIITEAENTKALEEINASIREGRPIDVTKLPDGNKLLDANVLKKIKDPMKRAEVETLQKEYRAAQAEKEPLKTINENELSPSERKADVEIRAEDAPEVVNRKMADIERTFDESPDFVIETEQGKLSKKQFVDEVGKSDELVEALTTCGRS